MKFVDDNCGNCIYFLSKDQIMAKISIQENREKLDAFLDAEFDSGCRCVRYPDPLETHERYWCGEYKRDPDADSR